MELELHTFSITALPSCFSLLVKNVRHPFNGRQGEPQRCSGNFEEEMFFVPLKGF
jgi:hypothetical protein